MDLVLHTRILSLRVITAGGSSRCSSEPPFTRGEGSGKLHSARTYDYLLRGTGAAWRLAQAGVRSNRSCSVGGSHEAAAWRLKRSVLLARCAELQWGVKGHHVRQHTKSKIENQKNVTQTHAQSQNITYPTTRDRVMIARFGPPMDFNPYTGSMCFLDRLEDDGLHGRPAVAPATTVATVTTVATTAITGGCKLLQSAG